MGVIQNALAGLGVAKLANKLGIGDGEDGLKMLGAESVMPNSAVGKAAGMKKGGSVSSASRRADGIATKGKTKGKMI